jgi:hypothetical protein
VEVGHALGLQRAAHGVGESVPCAME